MATILRSAAVALSACLALASCTEGTTTSLPPRRASVSPTPSAKAFVLPTVVPTPASATAKPGPCNGVRLSPGIDIQSAINRNPRGARFCFASGVYRLRRSLTPKGPNVFSGPRSAILDGSVAVGGWQKVDATTWAAPLPRPVNPISTYRCRPRGATMCHWNGDVFLDGVHLVPVESRSLLKAGRVYVDQQQRKAYIVQDPRGRKIEEAVADGIITGGAGWTLDGLTVQRAANDAQDGAIEGDNITVRNSVIRFNHAVGVYGHDRSVIANNVIEGNGQMGFAGYGGPITITGNEIVGNNTDGFEWEAEAGGGKCYKCPDARIASNYVHGNVGPGIWCDTDCIRAVIETNRVENNTGPGIYYEISYDGTIRNNLVTDNATDFAADPKRVGGGITVESSARVSVYGNTLANNGNGIILLATNRGADGYGRHQLSAVTVRSNRTLQPKGRTGLVDNTGDARHFTSLGNSFRQNVYVLRGNGFPFDWRGAKRKVSEWRSYGQDVDGSFD